MSLVPVAILFAWAVAVAGRKGVQFGGVLASMAVVWWGNHIYQSHYHDWVTDYHAGQRPYEQVGEYLRDQLLPTDTIYVVNDQMILYYLARTRPPTDYAYFHYIIDPHFIHVAQTQPEEEIDRIFSQRPKFIVATTPDPRLPVNPLIHYALSQMDQQYRLIKTIDHLNIYQRAG